MFDRKGCQLWECSTDGVEKLQIGVMDPVKNKLLERRRSEDVDQFVEKLFIEGIVCGDGKVRKGERTSAMDRAFFKKRKEVVPLVDPQVRYLKMSEGWQ